MAVGRDESGPIAAVKDDPGTAAASPIRDRIERYEEALNEMSS